ncbi:hypothetical protein BDR22DRAFT_872548 [Usnea florida]
MSSTFSPLSSSIIARQIARVSRPRPWVVPALVDKPVPVACSTTVRSSLSSLAKSAIVSATARACRVNTLSTVSSFASDKRIVGSRQSPVLETAPRPTTLAARASARASRDRPWLNPRSGSIATQVAQAESKTSQWIKSQAVEIRQAPHRPRVSREPSSTSVRHAPTPDTSIAIPPAPIVLPKRRTAATGPRQATPAPRIALPKQRTAVPGPRQATPAPRVPLPKQRTAVPGPRQATPATRIALPKQRTAVPGPRQAVRYPSTSDNRPVRSSSSSRPQELVTPASPDNSIAAIVREAFAFDIKQFQAEVQPLYDKIESHRKYLRRLERKPVTFDDNPKVIEVPRWIEKEHVHPRPPRSFGQLLGWRPISDSSIGHDTVWGSDKANYDHSDCDNPDCNRRVNDLYMLNYEEWTVQSFPTLSL